MIYVKKKIWSKIALNTPMNTFMNMKQNWRIFHGFEKMRELTNLRED